MKFQDNFKNNPDVSVSQKIMINFVKYESARHLKRGMEAHKEIA